MITMMLALSAAFADPSAEPRAIPINDRIEQLCTVSDTDLEGKRLAKECRRQVRAQFVARQTPERLTSVEPVAAAPVKPR